MRAGAFVLAVLMITAGCLGVAEDEEEGQPTEGQPTGGVSDAPATRKITRELVFELSLEQPGVADGRLEADWPADLAGGLVALDMTLTWTNGPNRFGLETERPDGSVHTIAPPQLPGSTEATGSIDDARPGTYAFHPTAQGAYTPDELTLTVAATFLVVDASQAQAVGGVDQTQVRTEQLDDGRWQASLTYEATGATSSTPSLEVDTVNGAIDIVGGAEEARALLEVWARAETEEQARERALEIAVSLQIDDEGIVATAHAPRQDGSEDWRNRGADAWVEVPSGATVSGVADTTNGPITVEGLHADGLGLDTTNGPITGSLWGQGALSMDTTNGPIQLELTPTGPATLEADATNGGIELGLAETDEIAYTLEADTTNGQITESMDEASLQGEDDEATLRTQDGAGRPIQVEGAVDTTNGNLHFAGR